MVFRLARPLVVCALAGGCSIFGPPEAEVVEESPAGIKMEIDHDAALKGIDSRAQAAEHCADYEKRAVWYGHDRDGHLDYKCE